MQHIHYKSLMALSLLTLSLGLSTPSSAVTNSLSTNAPIMSVYIGSQANHPPQSPRELTELEKEELRDTQKTILALSTLAFLGTGALSVYLTRRTRKERQAEADKLKHPEEPSGDGPSM